MHDLWFFIPLMTVLHRARGAGPIGPGRSIWYWTPILFGLCHLFGLAWPVAAVVALGYGIWATPAWSRWMGQIWGIEQPTTPLTWDQEIFELIGFGNPYVALVARFGLMLIPIALGLWWQGYDPIALALVPIAIVPATVIGGEHPSDPYMVEELVTGLVWGVALFAILGRLA